MKSMLLTRNVNAFRALRWYLNSASLSKRSVSVSLSGKMTASSWLPNFIADSMRNSRRWSMTWLVYLASVVDKKSSSSTCNFSEPLPRRDLELRYSCGSSSDSSLVISKQLD